LSEFILIRKCQQILVKKSKTQNITKIHPMKVEYFEDGWMDGQVWQS